MLKNYRNSRGWGWGYDKHPLEISGVWGFKQKCPPWGVWIFSGTTHYNAQNSNVPLPLAGMLTSGNLKSGDSSLLHYPPPPEYQQPPLRLTLTP